jgi:hypothetical protein
MSTFSSSREEGLYSEDDEQYDFPAFEYGFKEKAMHFFVSRNDIPLVN